MKSESGLSPIKKGVASTGEAGISQTMLRSNHLSIHRKRYSDERPTIRFIGLRKKRAAALS
jgi:hypothetical protein